MLFCFAQVLIDNDYLIKMQAPPVVVGVNGGNIVETGESRAVPGAGNDKVVLRSLREIRMLMVVGFTAIIRGGRVRVRVIRGTVL